MLADFVEKMRALTFRVSRSLNRPDLATLRSLREKMAADEERIRIELTGRAEAKEYLGKIPKFWSELPVRQKAHAAELKRLVSDEVAAVKAVTVRAIAAFGENAPTIALTTAIEMEIQKALERGRETALFISETESYFLLQSSSWRTTQSMVQFSLAREGTSTLNSSLMLFAATRVSDFQQLAGEPEIVARGLNLMLDSLLPMLTAVTYQRQFAVIAEDLLECIERLENSALLLYESEQVSVEHCKTLQEPLSRVLHLEETLRRRVLRTFKKGSVEKDLCAVVEQETLLLNSIFARCNNAFQIVYDALTKITNDTVEGLLLSNELACDDVKERTRDLLITILWYLEKLLTQDGAMKEERLHLCACSESRSPADSSVATVSSDRVEAVASLRLNAIEMTLVRVQLLVSDFKSLRRRLYPVMESSGILDTEPQSYLEETLSSMSGNSMSFSFLDKLETPLFRLEQLLQRYEKFLAQSINGLEQAQMEIPSAAQRDGIRVALADAIEAQRQLWSAVKHSTVDDRKLLELWAQRTAYAQLLGDEKLRLRAARRKEAYERLLADYKFILAIDAPPEIPLFVRSASALAERIEAKIGFELHEAVGQSPVLVAMSVLDRCIFLVESLDSYAATALNAKARDSIVDNSADGDAK
ncbi:MAG: hypothetical protein K2W95_17700 [Candidatus Obscuribacterales bacterium]|nr:hypothetical protein [Candidatus Obscuribacterales bacterium]